MNNLSKVLIFAAGAAIGSFITWKAIEEKYKRIADEEIESVKEVFEYSKEMSEHSDSDDEKKEETPVKVATATHSPEKPNIVDYAAMTRNLGYETTTDDKQKTETIDNDGPYTIDPRDFGMDEDYEEVSLLYHADGYLTDEDNVLVDDIETTVGFKCLDTFGEYESDAVYVQNDELKTYYEILRVDSNYSDLKDQEE